MDPLEGNESEEGGIAPDLTPEHAEFIEQKAKELFDYSIDCFDRARAEGTNVLQWLFGVIIGGMGMAGTLFTGSYWPLSFGFFAAVATAAWNAFFLNIALKSRYTMPPGNFTESLNALVDEPVHRMRWREARGMDARIQANQDQVESLSAAVDKARESLLWVPVFFLGGVLMGSVFWLVGKG